jgi:hypothetical protein
LIQLYAWCNASCDLHQQLGWCAAVIEQIWSEEHQVLLVVVLETVKQGILHTMAGVSQVHFTATT